MHTPVKNKSVENENRSRFRWWRWKLAEWFLSVYKFDGLPFEESIYYDVERRLNMLLLETGAAALTYSDMVYRENPIIGEVSQNDAKTWYGGSNHYTITTYLGSVTRRYDEIAICYNTPARRPMFYTIDHYAELLSNIEGAFKVNLSSQNTPMIIRAPQGQEITYSNLFEQVAGHKPVVYGRDQLLDEDAKSMFYLQPSAYVADKLELQRHDVINDFFFDIGVTSKQIEKKAQLISDEINIDRESIAVVKNSYLDARRAFCRQASILTDSEITCRLNVDALPKEYIDINREDIIYNGL